MRGHVREEDMTAILRGLQTDEAGVVLHLLGCPECQSLAQGLIAPVEQRGCIFGSGLSNEVDYQKMFLAIEARQDELLRRLLRERQEAEPLLKEICELEQELRLARIKSGGAEYRSLTLAHGLLEETRSRSGAERQSLAWVVLEIVGENPDEVLVNDLGLAAYSEIGEVARAGGRLDEAEMAFHRATSYLSGAIDPIERGRYCQLLARLRRDRQQNDEAWGLLTRALVQYRSAGLRWEMVAALIERGSLALELGELESARRDFERAGQHPECLTSATAWQVVQGIARSYLAENGFEQALATLELGSRRYRWDPTSRELSALAELQKQITSAAPSGKKNPKRGSLSETLKLRELPALTRASE